jgi:hypothetical protein
VGKRERTRLYSVRIGEPAELLAEMRVGGVSLQGHYVIGSSRKTILDGGPLQGVFEGYDDCAVSYIKPGFKVHCWDLWLEKRWPLSKYILMEYKWDDTIRVRGEDGTGKWIPNPGKRLIGKDGKPLLYALFLRDLNENILFRVDNDPVFAPWVPYSLVLSPERDYTYAACGVINHHLGLADGVCRYRLDGAQHQWEEVFRFDVPRKLKASIQQINVSAHGDVYFRIPGARSPYKGVWKFDAEKKTITQISQPGDFDEDDPLSSPDGRWVAFYRSSEIGQALFIGHGD